MTFYSTDINDYIACYNSFNLPKKDRHTKSKYIQQTDIEFQLLDIDHYHIEDDDGKKQFVITLFGRTKDDKSVCANLTNFSPWFFVEIDQTWRRDTIARIINDVKRSVYPKYNIDGLIGYNVVRKHKFYGFTNEEEFSFLQLTFRDYDAMRSYANAFTKKHKLLYISRERYITFNVYEANINPIIRFLHIQKLDPCGWVKIPASAFTSPNENYREGCVDINVTCRWDDVLSVQCSDIHKFRILSFDIECTSEDGKFPVNRDGDKVIQIGMTFSYVGESECYKKIILCLNETATLPDIDVRWFNSEHDLLLNFTQVVKEMDPDFLIGYNIYGFDFIYLKNRAEKLGILREFSKLSRINDHVCEFVERDLQSSALGQNKLKYYAMPGRISVDLMKVIQRDHKLASYKLDFVASMFIRDKICATEICTINNTACTKLHVKSTFGVNIGDFISIFYNDGYTDNRIGNNKVQIIDIEQNKAIWIKDQLDVQEYLANKWKVVWCQAKDDVEPKEIFKLFLETPASRARIAKYCVQDCVLCNRLITKLQIVPNSMGMGNVCCVPLSYLFLRGQGVKIFSLVSKYCREENYLIPVIKKKTPKNLTEQQLAQHKTEMKRFENFINSLINPEQEDDEEDEETYEGATVYDPVTGVHYSPIIVFDYGSLYPSSMIMKNLSHNSIVLDQKYDNLPGYIYRTQTYKTRDNEISYKFAEREDGKKATIPRILLELLAARKRCKNLMDAETDAFKRSVYDGLQLAYKITANSLYGQCGAPTSPIFLKPIAACTTAIGRDMLNLARDYVEQTFPVIVKLAQTDETEFMTYMNKLYFSVPDSKVAKAEYFGKVRTELNELLGNYNINPQCIYGDTDSVFFKLNMTNKETNKEFDDHDALKTCIKVGILSSKIINYTLQFPQVLNYEKVYWPFIIISKKRYVGNLYDFDPNSYYQKSMGLVTKRRDNADIVKMVVGGIIDQILNKRDKMGAIKFTINTLKKIITGKYEIGKFVITKTLKDKDAYADWTRIVHAVLADRMAQRDIGNKPMSNDRIPYVYIETKHKCKLQGEKVETPAYVIENGLKIDFLFYITNQIMKPAMQFLELIAENPNDIFKMYIIREENRRSGTDPIMKYCSSLLTNNNTDNILLTGATGDSLFGTSKKNETMHQKMRQRRDRRCNYKE